MKNDEIFYKMAALSFHRRKSLKSKWSPTLLQLGEEVNYEVCSETTALLKVGCEVVPASNDAARLAQPVLHHGK